ncbi:MAG TPA: SMP-30/gluconolactonase/LRE family protein [Anaeromyxobacteraceae bacterium]|nr:SMP-30/gluconolactonase/LRE family protein [Anaeromyxobacteraceae bacterium]
MKTRVLLTASVLLSVCAVPRVVSAWDRGRVDTFAVLPEGSGGPEGLEIDHRGNVYVGSFGITSQGPLTGSGRIFVFDRKGKLLREVTVAGSTAQLLGLRWRASTETLLVVDNGGRKVLEVNPLTGASTTFMTFPLPADASSSPNDITFDKAGNVYVSDSAQGTIWRTGKDGGTATAWVENEPLLQTTGVPPFGANGLRFNHGETALFVANTGNDTIVKIPVTGGSPATTGAPGDAEIFVNSVNGADGLIIDRDDNLWVVANQADEIVVIDPTGKAISKLGDFDGVRHGKPRGLLFPASLRFFGDRLLVTNLSLDLRLFNPAFQTVDSQWCAMITRYTVAILPARILGFDGGGRDGHDGRDDDHHDRDDD